MRTRFIFGALAFFIGIGGSLVGAQSDRQTSPGENHVAWVVAALGRMQTIRPGMTRKDLLAVFTVEGGLSTPLHRTFASRDCPYFKVDVEFEAVGRPARNRNGRVTSVEDDRDRIVTISRPYLQFSVLD